MLGQDIVFVDVETLGLDRDAPIWEFAAIRVAGATSGRPGEIDARQSFFIEHNPGAWPDGLPEEFRKDYRDRYHQPSSLIRAQAAWRVKLLTDGAIIAGSNPAFDRERLEILLGSEGLTPGWHYHPLDIPSMALGRLAGLPPGQPVLPWRSDELSQRIGVEPADYARHTAMGDVLWCLAQWRAMGGAVHMNEGLFEARDG